MIFGIGRCFAEIQILKKKVKLALSLEPFGIFDKILHTHFYWHDLDRGIAKSSPRDCKMTFNIGRGCAELQILKKNENGRTEWTIVMKLCIHIDIDKM